MAFADQNFIFAGNLLSAYDNPAPLTASLSSADGSVAVAVLSAYKGLAFEAVTIATTTSARNPATVAGNTFMIATAYHNKYFGLLHTQNRGLTIFQYNSGSTAQTSVSGSTTNATYPELRRLSILGYV